MKNVLSVALLIACVVFLAGNFCYGRGDMTEQVPLFITENDEAAFAKDEYVQSSQGFNIRFFYTQALRFVPESLFLPLYIALFLLVMYCCISIVVSLFGYDWLTSCMVMILITLGTSAVYGTQWMLQNTMFPGLFGWAFALLAIKHYTLKNRARALAFLVASLLFMPPLAAIVSVCLLVHSVLKQRTKWELLAIPILTYAFGLLSGVLGQDWQVYLYRYPHQHLFIDWGWTLHAFNLGLLLAWLFITSRQPSKKSNLFIHCFVLTNFTLILGYVLLNDVLGTGFLAQFQVYKAMPLVVLFMAVDIASRLKKWPKASFVALLLAFFVLTNVQAGGYEESSLGVEAWVKDNTDKDSLFMVSPEMKDFRSRTERSVVVDWMGFYFKDQKGWYNRINDVLNGAEIRTGVPRKPLMREAYDRHTEQSISLLAGKYGFSHFVSRKHYSGFNLVFEGVENKVYESGVQR